jgi:hypothetical protein
MANKRLADLPQLAALQANDLVYVVRGGTDYALLTDNLVALESGNYAGIGMHSNANATTIQAKEIPTLLTDYDENLPESISAGDYTNNRITVGANGDYHISMMGAFRVGAVNKECEVQAWQIKAATTAITSITAANPAVVTKVGHGLTSGDYVFITGVATMTEINDQIYKVVKLTDDTFSLDAMDDTDVNASGYAGVGAGGTFQLAHRILNGCQEAVSSGKIYNVFDSSIHALVTGDLIMPFVLNEDSADDVTVKYSHLKIARA